MARQPMFVIATALALPLLAALAGIRAVDIRSKTAEP